MGHADDPYLLPNGTLRNKLGITSQSQLSQAETDQVAVRELAFRGRLPSPPFGFSTLLAMHRELFQDVYDWAGQPRTTTLAKREYDHPASPVQRFTAPDAPSLLKPNRCSSAWPTRTSWPRPPGPPSPRAQPTRS